MKSHYCNRRSSIELAGILPIQTLKEKLVKAVARNSLASITFCVLAACHSTPRETSVTPLPTSYLHYAEVRLRSGQPKDSAIKFKLVYVAENLRTAIQLDTGEVLIARPGEFYCAPLAPLNLQLVAAFPETGEAVFRWQLK